jgi:hypothetical protein
MIIKMSYAKRDEQDKIKRQKGCFFYEGGHRPDLK